MPSKLRAEKVVKKLRNCIAHFWLLGNSHVPKVKRVPIASPRFGSPGEQWPRSRCALPRAGQRAHALSSAARVIRVRERWTTSAETFSEIRKGGTEAPRLCLPWPSTSRLAAAPHARKKVSGAASAPAPAAPPRRPTDR
jgi:hypothetical protein